MQELKIFFQSKRNVVGLIVFLILILAIPLGIYLVKTTQIFAPKAEETGSIVLAEGNCVTTINGDKVLTCKEVPLRLVAPSFNESSPSPSSPILSWQTKLLSQATRLYDTRPNSGLGGANQPLRGYSNSSPFQISGKGEVPTDANGALVNITVISRTSGWLAAWPTGERQPNSSIINYNANSYQAGTTFVKLNANGSFDLVGEEGANVIIDVLGYTVNRPITSSFDKTSLLSTPTRIIDTRSDSTSLTGYSSPKTYILTGKGGIPSNASAVIANITTTNHTENGWITFWPSGNPKPETSNLNYQQNQSAMANFAVLKLGSNGGIDMVGTNGVNVLIDVAGYINQDTSAGSSNPSGQIHLLTESARVVDTRANTGLDGSGTPLKGLSIPNRYTIAGIANVPRDAAGAIITVTALNYTGNSWISVFPAGTTSETSNLSLSSGQAAIANTAVVKLNNGVIDVVGPQGTNLLIDVIGYVSP